MSLRVGIQLYSVRKAMKADPVDTIRKVAETGYRYLEVANHNAMSDYGVGFGISSEELNSLLKKTNASVASAHIFPFNEENYKHVIAYNQRIGNSRVVYPMETFRNHDDALRIATLCEKMGALAHSEGMQFFYHNHYQEFQVFENETVLDTIMRNTDPAHVSLELDTFWTLRAGLDPVEAIRHFGTRIKLLHQKDMSKETKTPVNMFDVVGKDAYIDRALFVGTKCNDDFIEIGLGRMDIQAIIDAANEVGGVDYMFLEQDATKLDEIESIKQSMEGFRKFSGIVWD